MLPTDHLVPAQVRAPAERIDAEQGRLDVLVNDVWGGERLFAFDKAVWEHGLDNGLRLLRLGVETHAITSHLVLPLFVRRPGGLVVEMTDGTSAYNATHYRNSHFYDLVKNSVLRMAFVLAHELTSHGGTAATLTAGRPRSEMMLDTFDVTEDNWRDALTTVPHFCISESPSYVGRAVAALAGDADIARWNGQSLSSGQLAQEYGSTKLTNRRTRPVSVTGRGASTPAGPSVYVLVNGLGVGILAGWCRVWGGFARLPRKGVAAPCVVRAAGPGLVSAAPSWRCCARE